MLSSRAVVETPEHHHFVNSIPTHQLSIFSLSSPSSKITNHAVWYENPAGVVWKKSVRRGNLSK